MGNHKFRLSDMMPNAWFYKLKDMSRATKNQSIQHSIKKITPPNPYPPPPSPAKQPFLVPSRTSYYFPSSDSPIHPKASDTHFPPFDPPRRSKRRSNRRKPVSPSTRLISSSVSSASGCSCRVWRSKSIPEHPLPDSPHTPLYSADDDDDDSSHPILAAHRYEFDACRCRIPSSAADIILDTGGKSKDFDATSEIELPPIITKPAKKELEQSKLEQSKTPAKGIHRLRLRANSPRISTKRAQTQRNRKSSGMQQKNGLSESFAVVKSSSDPRRDFRDSMVEMIVENNIRASKDLEDLLACYLTLNSNEYHDVIVKVFKQIWFDLTDVRL